MSLSFKIVAVTCLILTIQVSALEKCSWYYGGQCPISAGSSPNCGMENPKKIDEGINSITICTYENPKFFGGNYDVICRFPGNIIEIGRGGIRNCGWGSGENTTTFYSHCESSGSNNMYGLWNIKYYTNSTTE